MKSQKLYSELDKIFHDDKNCCYADCKEFPIKSHTISGNYLHKLNADLTKILTFEPALVFMADGNTPGAMRRVKKDNFSTFRGFCNNHDNELFSLIDSYDGVMSNEKATLIHYRIICFGINHIKTQKLRVQHLAKQNYIEDNIIGRKIAKKLQKGSFTNRLDYCLSLHLSRKKLLEDIIQCGNFDDVEFIEMHGQLTNPIFFGRSSFLLHPNEKIFNASYGFMPWITYMTLPGVRKMDLIFCWLKNDNNYAKKLNFKLKKEGFNKTIEKLAYAYGDAFAIEQSFYDHHVSTIEAIKGGLRVY